MLSIFVPRHGPSALPLPLLVKPLLPGLSAGYPAPHLYLHLHLQVYLHLHLHLQLHPQLHMNLHLHLHLHQSRSSQGCLVSCTGLYADITRWDLEWENVENKNLEILEQQYKQYKWKYAKDIQFDPTLINLSEYTTI